MIDIEFLKLVRTYNLFPNTTLRHTNRFLALVEVSKKRFNSSVVGFLQYRGNGCCETYTQTFVKRTHKQIRRITIPKKKRFTKAVGLLHTDVKILIR